MMILQDHETNARKDSIKVRKNVRAQSVSLESRLSMRRENSRRHSRNSSLGDISTFCLSESGGMTSFEDDFTEYQDLILEVNSDTDEAEKPKYELL